MDVETKGREFEIAAEVANLLDTLTKEQQNQVMAMLATRYGLTIKHSNQTAGKLTSPRLKRRW